MHFHGLPMTPELDMLRAMAGKHAMVSYEDHRQIETAAETEPELMLICDTPGCLFMAEHYAYECFTAQDCEEQAEREYWDQYPEVRDLINMGRAKLNAELDWLHTEVMRSIVKMVDDARLAVGLQALMLCRTCGHAGRHPDCDDFPL